ncbi:hypothetical protein D9M69_553800 [compost metagenome]
MQLPVADVDAHHLGGAVLQQAVGEATGRLADVQAELAGRVHAAGLQRAFELEAAARHVARLGGVGELELGRLGHFVLVLGDVAPRVARARVTPAHAAGDEPHSLRTRRGQAALHQQLIGAHADQ